MQALHRAAEMYGITPDAVIDSRRRDTAEPRFLVCLAAHAAGASYPAIAASTRRKDHTGVIYACRRAIEMVDTDEGARAIFEEIYDAAINGTELVADKEVVTYDEPGNDPYEVSLARIRSRVTPAAQGFGAG